VRKHVCLCVCGKDNSYWHWMKQPGIDAAGCYPTVALGTQNSCLRVNLINCLRIHLIRRYFDRCSTPHSSQHHCLSAEITCGLFTRFTNYVAFRQISCTGTISRHLTFTLHRNLRLHANCNICSFLLSYLLKLVCNWKGMLKTVVDF
jgi:hypothetical protein